MLQYKISGKQEYIPRNWLMRQCQTHVCRKESDQWKRRWKEMLFYLQEEGSTKKRNL